MRSKRNGGDPADLRALPVVDGGGRGEGKPVCGGESEEPSSGVTQELLGEPPPRSEGATSMTANSSEWTDEKHRSYLNSMEASFVRQLYDQECFSAHLLNWSSKKRKLLNQRPTESTTGSSPFSQFKVLQKGCWKKIDFDYAAKDKWQLFANPWIQHFVTASSSKMHTLAPSSFWGKLLGRVKIEHVTNGMEGCQVHLKSMLDRYLLNVHRSAYSKIMAILQRFQIRISSDEEDTSLVKGSQTKKLQKWNPQASGVDKVKTETCYAQIFSCCL